MKNEKEIQAAKRLSKQLEISITMTHSCNLGCKYCYECEKASTKISRETLDKIMDFFMDSDYYGQAEDISVEFFGGEPLLEWENIKYFMDNFPKKIVEKKPEWLGRVLFYTTSNGTLLNSKEVQEFVKQYPELRITLSIDGNKESHDMNRVYLNGGGTFDDTIKGLNFLKSIGRVVNVKGTFSKSTLPMVGDSLIWQMQNGFQRVWANPIFEEDWTEEDGQEYYKQLLKAMDYRFDNNLQDKVAPIGVHANLTDFHQTHCGTGSHIASVDVDGTLYPCSRLMYGDHTYPIGNVYTDVDLDKLTKYIFMCYDFDQAKDKPNGCCYAYCYACNGCMTNETAPKTWIMEKYAARADAYENARQKEIELGWAKRQ